MPEPQADARIDQLMRANRRWKFLALGTLAALVLAIVGLTTYTVLQAARARAGAEAARAEAEQVRQETKEALEDAARARRHAEQILYASHIQMAQQAWEEGARENMKP
jgi:hypothetical protein